MRARTVIADYFSFNRAEQRGIAILILALVILLLLNRYLPEKSAEPPVGTERFRQEVAAFEQEVERAEEEKRNKRGRKNVQRHSYPMFSRDTSYKLRQKPPELFIELNGADTLDLQQLRGIGPGFARRIVGYRKKLGGFADRRQLLEVYGMDRERYMLIRDHVYAEPDSVKRIDLNNATFKMLISHPYFPYEITKEIILYRKKVKRFNSPEEMMNVKGFTDSLFRKVSPYIAVD